jgi:phage protein D
MTANLQYIPEFKIRISDEDIPAAMRASTTQVSYTDGTEGADQVQISLANPDLRWLDHPLLNLNNKLSLSIGYAPNNLEEMFVGEITTKEASFPNGGVPTVTIRALDLTHRLQRGTKERGFGSLSDPAIVGFIAVENGLKPMLDPGAALSAVLSVLFGRPRFQDNRSDFEFLTQIAKDMDVKMFVEGDTLSFRMLQEVTPRLSLQWGRSLLDFSPSRTNIGEIFGVSIKVWLKELKLNFVVAIAWNFDAERLDIQVVPGMGESALESVGQPKIKLLDQPISDPTDIAPAVKKALSMLKTQLNQLHKGNGSAVGDTRIRAGAMIELGGVGEFSGNYRVVSTTHSVDTGGYRTTFEARREIIPEIFA